MTEQIVRDLTPVRKPDPMRVFHADGGDIARYVGEVDGTEEAVELCRLDATRKHRWGTYRALRPGQPVMDPVYISVHMLGGEYQALIVRDPLNPRMTDEAVMSRFDDPEEAAAVPVSGYAEVA